MTQFYVCVCVCLYFELIIITIKYHKHPFTPSDLPVPTCKKLLIIRRVLTSGA